MRHSMVRFATLAGVMLAVAPAWADQGGIEKFHATLAGFNEIGALTGPTGAILSDAAATADVELDPVHQTATYTLNITSAPATGITQAHIHFGKVHVAGGVMVFFCTNLTPPVGAPTPPHCPASGSVTGTWTAANVVLNAQGVTPGNFEALVDALESNTAYANIHTTQWPAGEIRGQMHRGHGDRDDRD